MDLVELAALLSGDLACLDLAELAFSKVFPRPQGVLARPIFGRTGIAKRYGVLFIYREPGTGNWEHSLVFFIDTVHRAQRGTGTGPSGLLGLSRSSRF